MKSAYTAVDAFSGAGGLGLGLTKAGFDVRLSFDFDKHCIETLGMNPEFVRHPAVTARVEEMVGGEMLERAGLLPGELDLLAGGPPCQGFSVQRTTGDDEDERNLLVGHYGNLIAEARPRFFLMENVPGIAGKRGKALLDEFDARMSDEGYVLHHKILDAQDFGVPQRRRRYFVVGEREDQSPIGIAFRWPEGDDLPRKSVRDAIGHLPPTPENGVEHPQLELHRADRLSAINLTRIRAIKEGQSRVDLPTELLAKCHLSPDKIGHRATYGRMYWDQVAPTITARFDSFTRGRFGHPEADRSITLREGALLQTFPESYRFSGNKVEVARQIGNAVPVEFGRAVSSAINSALHEHDRAGEKAA